MKLRDFVNPKVNSANNQNSFDIRSRKLKELDISIEDLLNLPINKKIKEFRKS